MKLICKRCNSDEVFEVPNFSLEEKIKLWESNKISPLKTVVEIRNMHNVTLKNAKFITSHINLKTNTCLRCNTELTPKEYISCSKCNSLNFNWNLKS